MQFFKSFLISIAFSCLSLIGYGQINDRYIHLGYSLGPGQGVHLVFDNYFTSWDQHSISGGVVFNARFQDIDQGTESDAILGGRMTYHHLLESVRGLSVYGSVLIGAGFVFVNNDRGYQGSRMESETRYLAVGASVGVKYMPVRFLGLFVEAGYGTGYVSGGLVVNWKK